MMFTKEVRRGGGGVHMYPHKEWILLCVLLQASYGGSYGGILRGVIPRFSGDDPWGPPIPHHLQCGGVSSGVLLDIVVGKRRERERRVGKGGDTPRRHFLRRWWPGCINVTSLVAGIVWHLHRCLTWSGSRKIWEDHLLPLPCGGEPVGSNL